MEGPTIALEDGLDLHILITSSSILSIKYVDCNEDNNVPGEEDDANKHDRIGEPVECFEILEKELMPLDDNGYVKKKILEEGGGMPLHEECTISISYSAYWENHSEPFDIWMPNKPLVVNLKENGLLLGVSMAVQSMLVGETSLFLLSHQVAYGELGMPPRVKPRAKCIFYIKLIKSILTPEEGLLVFSQPNSFGRVYREVKIMFVSGVTLYKSKNFSAAIQLFKKGVNMLHKCHLADEEEEIKQQKLLVKLYINLAVCYNITKQPLKACTSCNELNRLDSLWNNGKVLFQNAKALRMIGQFEEAHKKIKRAIKLNPDNTELQAEMFLIEKTSEECNTKIFLLNKSDLINNNFKREIDNLIKNFKQNINLCKLILPPDMNFMEMEYVREACIKENLFFNQIEGNFLLDKEDIHEEKDFLNFM